MNTLKLIKTIKANLSSISASNGSLIICDDSKEIFFDFDGVRINISSIVYLETEDELNDILIPLPKLYLVRSNNTIWFPIDGQFTRMNSEIITDLGIKTPTDEEVPSAKAVVDYINKFIEELPISSSGGKGLNYIYFDTPSQDELELDDYILIDIEFSNNDDFSTKVEYSLSDCKVFNPATGTWINPPEEGLGISFCDTKLRMNIPDGYSLCRYKWRYTDNSYVTGSYKVAVL